MTYSHNNHFKSDISFPCDITIFYINYKWNLIFSKISKHTNSNYDSIHQNSNFTHREILEQTKEVDLKDLDVTSALL